MNNTRGKGELMSEQHRGIERRRGSDRRTVDLWRQLGRPGFDLRTSIERRSGRDRRRAGPLGSPEHDGASLPDVVMPWQIAEMSAG